MSVHTPDAKPKPASTFHRRIRVLSVLVAAFFLVNIGRLWQLQVTRYERYHELATRDRSIEKIVPAPRGPIYTRNGELLAEDRPVFDLSVRTGRLGLSGVKLEDFIAARERLQNGRKINPAAANAGFDADCERLAALLEREPFVRNLARTVKRDPAEVAGGLQKAFDTVARNWATPYTPLRIVSEIDQATWLALRAAHEDVFRDSYLLFGKSAEKMPESAAPPFPGLVCTLSSRRVYPQGRLGCFVIGALGELPQADEDVLRTDGILIDNAKARRDYWDRLRDSLDDARAARLEQILRVNPQDLRDLGDLYGTLAKLRPTDADAAGALGLAEPLRWTARPPRMQLTETESLWLGVGLPPSTSHNNLPNPLIGELGVERYYNDMLRGKYGMKLRESLDQQDDASLEFRRNSQPREGDSLALTISLPWQKAVERALHSQEHPGAVVVMDCHSGEVLALASWPDFDPNVFSPPRDDSTRQKQIVSLLKDPNKPLLDRALSEQYALGSCMKALVAAVALEKGLVTPQETLECHGYLTLGQQKFHCDGIHGTVDLLKALRVSCNAYFQQVGSRIGVENLAPYAKLFFGRRTGIDLPGEVPGIYPDREWRLRTFPNNPAAQRWTLGNDYLLSIGQGQLTSTVIQAATMMSAFANGGTVVTPRLWLDGPQVPARSMGISPRNIALVREGLDEVVNCATPGAAGTAYSSFHNLVPELAIRVAGKTSSAEHKKGAKTHGWFCGFAPENNPQIAFAVMIENAGHGGAVAAPVAYKFLREIYGTRSAPNPTPGQPLAQHDGEQ